jgi:hypothetical protein
VAGTQQKEMEEEEININVKCIVETLTVVPGTHSNPLADSAFTLFKDDAVTLSLPQYTQDPPCDHLLKFDVLIDGAPLVPREGAKEEFKYDQLKHELRVEPNDPYRKLTT